MAAGTPSKGFRFFLDSSLAPSGSLQAHLRVLWPFLPVRTVSWSQAHAPIVTVRRESEREV